MSLEFTPRRLPARLEPPRGVDLWLCPRAPGERSTPGLRRLLAAYLGLAADAVPLATQAHGRPVLHGGGLAFSASHAGDWLLHAVSAQVQPGVDLEPMGPRPRALALAQRYFTAAEAARLQALEGPAREQAFYRLWTAREAVLKALGRGLAFGLDRLRIGAGEQPVLEWIDGDEAACWQLQGLQPVAGYVAALAWRGPPLPLQAFRLQPDAPRRYS